MMDTLKFESQTFFMWAGKTYFAIIFHTKIVECSLKKTFEPHFLSSYIIWVPVDSYIQWKCIKCNYVVGYNDCNGVVRKIMHHEFACKNSPRKKKMMKGKSRWSKSKLKAWIQGVNGCRQQAGTMQTLERNESDNEEIANKELQVVAKNKETENGKSQEQTG